MLRSSGGMNIASVYLNSGNDALEQFFVCHPDLLLNREVEAATVDFANPFIHLGHLAAAAYEGALDARDERFFGPGLPTALGRAEEEGLVRRKNDSWFFVGPGFPAGKIGLRSTAGEQYTIVDGETGFLVPYGDATAFGEKAADILGDAELWKRMSGNSLERVKELTWERCARETERILLEVVSRR